MLGKPAFNDVKEGIVTAPLIYALLQLKASGQMEAYGTLNEIVLRNFQN